MSPWLGLGIALRITHTLSLGVVFAGWLGAHALFLSRLLLV